MAIRVRGIIALVLVVTSIFVSISTFLAQDAREGALARSLRSGRQYFRGEVEVGSEDILATDEAHLAVVAAPAKKRVTADETDPLSEEPKKPARPHAHHEVQASPVASQASTSTSHSAQPSDDIRLLIGVMSPFWASAKRQIIRNGYNRFPKDLPVDIVFVEGNMTNNNPENYDKVLEMQRTAVSWENQTYGDIMHVDCVENLEYGKTYEYLSKVGREFSNVYTHVMKTDDDSFVNIPGNPLYPTMRLIVALVEVLRAQKNQTHFYWGTTWREENRQHEEMWGSGYILSMDLIKWISEAEIPKHHTWGFEDYQVCYWLIEGGLDDNFVVNRTAFAGYPWPELGDRQYKQENDIKPFDRWTLVTHPLKEDFMWVDTAEYYLGLKW